jgi:hypothetical protein
MEKKYWNSVVSARIHPAIGIARIGNSTERCFIGPEVLWPVKREPGFYRDHGGRLKRQAARFRIYGYDANGKVIGELTSDDAEITWTVHVANKKAAWYDFDVALDIPEAAGVRSPRRNAQIEGDEREKLIIDPGPREISGNQKCSVPLKGKFLDEEVYLGELRTDDQGRLIFLGGLGKSGTPYDHCFPPTTFANNAGWHDDTSDGPVRARLSIGDRDIEAEPAWVVVAPPNYAPDLVAGQSMYDVILDALTKRLLPKQDPNFRPSFSEHILPLFRHFTDAQWVSVGFYRLFGKGGLIDFTREEFLKALATPPHPKNPSDPYKELRSLIFNNFREPGAADFEPLKWPPAYGDSFGSSQTPSPRDGFTITSFLYSALEQWANGDFIGDFEPDQPWPQAIEDLSPAAQPAMLDRAALTYCMGGPFHTAMELSWPMRIFSMYKSPFRLRTRPENFEDPDYGDYMTTGIALSRDGPLSSSGPGDITKWMAVPWQTDTASCRAGSSGPEFPADDFLPAFWVSRVPSQVLTELSFKTVNDPAKSLEERIAAFQNRADWLRKLHLNGPSIPLITEMVYRFGEVGVIERREVDSPGPGLPDFVYVENLPEEEREPAGQQNFPHDADLLRARYRNPRG